MAGASRRVATSFASWQKKCCLLGMDQTWLIRQLDGKILCKACVAHAPAKAKEQIPCASSGFIVTKWTLLQAFRVHATYAVHRQAALNMAGDLNLVVQLDEPTKEHLQQLLIDFRQNRKAQVDP